MFGSCKTAYSLVPFESLTDSQRQRLAGLPAVGLALLDVRPVATLSEWVASQGIFLDRAAGAGAGIVSGDYGSVWLFRLWQLFQRFRNDSPAFVLDSETLEDLERISPDARGHFEQVKLAAGSNATVAVLRETLSYTDAPELLSMYMCFFMDSRVATAVSRLGGQAWLSRECPRLRQVAVSYRSAVGQWPHPLELLANATTQWFMGADSSRGFVSDIITDSEEDSVDVDRMVESFLDDSQAAGHSAPAEVLAALPPLEEELPATDPGLYDDELTTQDAARVTARICSTAFGNHTAPASQPWRSP